ncbi:pancreatic triacylglycerol lipase-like [Epargyreus clarus]|uniref:pancreatic triacylglycerol lipase-like n=1 Tax=Epargyreus clarus TaxID=520877 RepID=UPI003C2F02E3
MTLVDLEAPVSEEEIRSAERAGQNNRYWLFTRRNPNSHQELRINNANSVFSSHYMPNRPIMVVVHGYNGKGQSAMNTQITSAYLAVADANVIVVDWSSAASGLYSTSVRAVPSVGQGLGDFLTWLLRTAGGNWNQMHLVGYSLGAHVVGNAGRRTGGRPVRITGMDPAGPQWGGNSNALNRNDGVYVESIHTDGGFYGIFDPISNADFYPNGGRHAQPGCWVNSCSHGRAPELFASSVRTNHFAGRQCANLQQVRNDQCTGGTLRMGNSDLNKRGNGLFRLNTRANWPF